MTAQNKQLGLHASWVAVMARVVIAAAVDAADLSEALVGTGIGVPDDLSWRIFAALSLLAEWRAAA